MPVKLNLARFFKRASKGVLDSLAGAVEQSLENVRTDIAELDVEYILATSSGRWLDEWGDIFSVPRKENEADAPYRGRIQSIANRPKNTIPAIISSIVSHVGNADDDITIYEPFTNMKKFNISTFSGPDKFPDANYYRPSVIDIRTSGTITDALRAVVDKVKSAGVRVYFTFSGEIGNKDPIFMGTNALPNMELYRDIDLLVYRFNSDTVPVNIGMSYLDISHAEDIAFSEYEYEVEMSVYIYKTITAGSLLTITSLSDVKIDEATTIPDDTLGGFDLFQEGGSH